MTILTTKRKEIKPGGKGTIIMEHLVDEEVFGGQNKLFAQVTLKPGCAVGYHQHVGTNETYYVLKGEGTYNDNGEKTVIVKAGETTFCADGEYHGFENTGTEDLVFIALIANTPKK